MQLFLSSLNALLWLTLIHPNVSQTLGGNYDHGYSKGKGFTPAPSPSPSKCQIGQRKPLSKYSTVKSCNKGTGSSSFNLVVEIDCMYYPNSNSQEGKPCTTKGIGMVPNNTPFLNTTFQECPYLEGDMRVTYRMCNKDCVQLTPTSSTRIRFSIDNDNPSQNWKDISPSNWKDQLGPNECRRFTHVETGINYCKLEGKPKTMEIFMKGQETPNKCYLFKRAYANITDGTQKPPTSSQPPSPTRSPISGPTSSPSEESCNESDVIITELASPFDAPNGRYIELYFRDCKGRTLRDFVTLVSWKNEGGHRNLKDSLSRALQDGVATKQSIKGVDISENGMAVICKSNKAEALYGKGTCNAIGGLDSTSDVDGADSFAIMINNKIIDIYGIPSQPRNQDFSGGRAVRKFTLKNNFNDINPSGDDWVFEEWEILPNQSYKTMDPGTWACNESDVIITELASPFDALNGRYIELYFRSCKGQKLPGNVTLISWKNEGGYRNLEDSLSRALQLGRTVVEQNITAGTDTTEKGILTACRSKRAEVLYGQGTCDAIGGSDSPSDVDGTDTVIIKTQDGIRDIYGVPGRRQRGQNRDLNEVGQDFSGGRAVRKFTLENNLIDLRPSIDEWVFEQWEILPNQSYRTMDPKVWEPLPEINLFITEIVDPKLDSPVPRFVEVYAPDPENRDMDLEGNLKLVIFRGSSKTPDWDSAISLEKVPTNGFFVICNQQANSFWRNACTTIINSNTGVVNSNGDDQIAVVNGSKTNYKIVDIFGKIGSSGTNTAHNFEDSRAARLRVIDYPLKEWSKKDWVINISDGTDADPGEWRDPTQVPSSAPSEKFVCDIFITELASPLNNYNLASYIEIKTTCPGKQISKPLYVLTLGDKAVKLQGFTVPDDGYLIICAHEEHFSSTYNGKSCDFKASNFFSNMGHNPVTIIEDNGNLINADGNVRHPNSIMYLDDYLDTYGHPGKILDESHVFADGRAIRRVEYPHSMNVIDRDFWEVYPGTTQDMDPRDWKEVPMILIFTELADPVDSDDNRFIELYSPNKRNYLIKEDLSVIKYHENQSYPTSVNTSLKGLMINKHGFLVICAKKGYLGQNLCDEEVGYISALNSAGDHHYVLAECLFPPTNCRFIDVFGILGTMATGSNHDFTNGRAVRRLMTTPMASKVFDPLQWYIVPGEGDLEVSLDVCDPGEWKHVDPYPTPPPTKQPSPAPTSKGKGKWKKGKKRTLR